MAKKPAKSKTSQRKPMSIWQLFFYIFLAVGAFWLLSLVLDFAKWLLNIALVAGFIVVVVRLVDEYWMGSRSRK